jgi:hypothetical protein
MVFSPKQTYKSLIRMRQVMKPQMPDLNYIFFLDCVKEKSGNSLKTRIGVANGAQTVYLWA